MTKPLTATTSALRLHCGECLEVFTGGKWKPTHMEYGDNWYLAGVRAEDLRGLLVRI